MMNWLKTLMLLRLLILTIQSTKLTDTKINEIGKEIIDHDNDQYIATQEFNKLTLENFAAGLAQANLTSKNYIAVLIKKTDFDGKLKNINEKLLKSKLISLNIRQQ